MEAKDKAKELVDRFIDYAYHWDEGFTLPKEDTPIWNAKQCALICVDEMKLILPFGEVYTEKMLYYFEQVKQEINLL